MTKEPQSAPYPTKMVGFHSTITQDTDEQDRI